MRWLAIFFLLIAACSNESGAEPGLLRMEGTPLSGGSGSMQIIFDSYVVERTGSNGEDSLVPARLDYRNVPSRETFQVLVFGGAGNVQLRVAAEGGILLNQTCDAATGCGPFPLVMP